MKTHPCNQTTIPITSQPGRIKLKPMQVVNTMISWSLNRLKVLMEQGIVLVHSKHLREVSLSATLTFKMTTSTTDSTSVRNELLLSCIIHTPNPQTHCCLDLDISRINNTRLQRLSGLPTYLLSCLSLPSLYLRNTHRSFLLWVKWAILHF